MPNQILHKRSDTPNAVPTAAQLAVGEIALNTADGKAYTKKGDGEVVELTKPTAVDGGVVTAAGFPWIARAAAEANSWQAITYGDGLFAAVASDGTNRVMTSPDGTNWTARASAAGGRSAPWNSVTHGYAQANAEYARPAGNLFVAVAYSGSNRVMISPDGFDWTPIFSIPSLPWTSVTYGDGLFVAVAAVTSFASQHVATSSDGVNWTMRPSAAAGSNQLWNSVTYGNGLFVAVAYGYGLFGPSAVMTSPNGINWTDRQAPYNGWTSVTYGDGLFVAVASDGANRVMTSPDGINWTERQAPLTYDPEIFYDVEADGWNAVTYGAGLFVAVATNGTNRVMTSPDGINWTVRSPAEANSWRAITYGGGLFAAVASDGTNRVMTAP